MEADGPECQRVKLYLWTLYIRPWNILNVRFLDFLKMVGNDWNDSTLKPATLIQKGRPILTHLVNAESFSVYSRFPVFPFGVIKTILGNHDMQQAFNMRSYESDFNEVEDEDVYNLLLARDRPDLEEAKQKPPKLTEIILS